MSPPMNVWQLLNLHCDGMSRLASESLDRELRPIERFALRSHLFYCSACRRYMQQIRILRDAMRRLATALEPVPATTLPDDVRQRIKHALREH